MDLLKSYLESNKKSLLIYIGVCLFFYIVNFAFFRNNVETPVDLIFTVLFIFVASGTVVLFTLFNSDILTTTNRIFLILINLFVPFLVSLLFAMIYWAIEMQNSATLSEILLVQGFSFPIMFLSVIVVLLFKCYKIRISKLLQIGVVVFVVYYSSLFGFGFIEKQIENSIVTIIGYILLFLVFPFGYIMYLIIKMDAILD